MYMLKWILIVWIISAEYPLGSPLTYGTWHDAYNECYGFASNNVNEVIIKLSAQYRQGFALDDIDCMDTYWYKSNIIDSGFEIEEITGIPKANKASQ